ncbi:TIGR03960 family B12-binding radical SAM protein [Kosmotoga sp.]|uniref:TIGR03960 family B12-binding radical SAM protein n=1 Tax=Kosmotoga sp. TaxID=1955248 RepID=UPI0024AAD7E3|nr:TIGR03960 family B12-binding radical SAM protein [Kosmotoga sp.]MDI3523651.1 hypothetical protein [Kosmotoga sp.]
MDIYRWLVSSGVLSTVKKPSRYIGKELNIVKKDPRNKLRFLLAFPDAYEIGMSHLGLKLLYKYLNEDPEIYAERTYLPWKDMIAKMKENNVPLYSMETYTPAKEFHIFGITLQYELSFTNVIALLDLAEISIWQKDRTTEPLVIGGGPCTANPEPIADFFDAFVIGDGESITLQLARIVKENLDLLKKGKRRELLEMLKELPGMYVPSLNDGKVVKAVISDINDYRIDTKPVVPFMGVVHDRAVVEVMRGCDRGCRFCQAGMFYRPVRERNHKAILEDIKELIDNTGYEELSFLSLSTMDYTAIQELTNSILPYLGERKVALSLPSTRVDSFGIEIASKIASVRKTGLTFAPEAGTQRLRDVINKNISEEDLMNSVNSAIKHGWRRLKLYFMIGLPTETEEDINGIVELARKAKKAGLKDVTVSVSIFVPKPHTPFQFAKQIDPTEARKKMKILRAIKKFGKLQVHDPGKSYVEGVLSRGDRKVAKAIYRAYTLGALFDEWGEEFSFSRWLKAFEESGIKPEEYTRERSISEPLPWDHVSLGIRKEFLIQEYKKALRGETTPDCRWDICSLCGVCPDLKVANRLIRILKH